MTYVIGVDIGGTFTDAFASDERGDTYSAKAPSTPSHLADGVVAALEELAGSIGLDVARLLTETSYICHGTTATLNALVTGNLPRVGFLTTRGHADSIRIMNTEGRTTGLSPEAIQDMPQTDKPPPLVAREFVREIDERVDYKGDIVVPLDEEGARRAIDELLALDVEAVAVSLLWSFRNPVHEQAVGRLVHDAAPGMYVGLSSVISPRIREFSRSVTTIMSTLVAPRLEDYLVPLEKQLRSLGFTGSLLVMQGSGGTVTALDAPVQAISTVGSVLTGGIVGCTRVGATLDHSNIISTDMGGTTFLAGIVVDREPVMVPTSVVGRYRVNTPMVEVTSIGSGGGAIAWLDAGGNLRVGPDSAAAHPGPACYGEGGHRPTITDANLLLGILSPDRFLGGRKPLYPELAEKALEELGTPLGLGAEEAAVAVYSIANAQMADLVRRVVVGAGYDPRDFVVYAFGGAGPVHCASYSADLGVKEVVVPLGRTAAAFSAYGLAASDVVVTAETSNPCNFPLDPDDVNATFLALEQRLAADLDRQGLRFSSVVTTREIDIRYSLQLAEVPTPVPVGALSPADVEAIAETFEDRYAKLFGEGTGYREAGLQALTYRVFARGVLPTRPSLPRLPASPARAQPVPIGRRDVWLTASRGRQSASIYDYADLGAGMVIEGPAVVAASTTTVVVPDAVRGSVDPWGNMRLEFGR